MRAVTLAFGVGLVASVLSAAPPSIPGATVAKLEDGWRADIAFDGPILGWALPRDGRGARVLHVLVGPKAPESQPGPSPCTADAVDAADRRDARLYRWSPAAPGRMETAGTGLPEGSLESADLDGDGTDELLLARRGGIDLIESPSGGEAAARELVRDDELGTSCCGPRIAWDPRTAEDDALRIPLLGAYRTYRGNASGGVRIVSQIAIPQHVSAGRERVQVASPEVAAVGRMKDTGRMVFATEPEASGRRRLHTLLLDPDGPPETRAVASWALLPGPERVVDAACAIVNGAPVLIVTTTSAEKLSLLGDKALRIYPLGGDRTRAGDTPLFAATTGINLWQQAYPAVIDLDGDGRDELVLAYWKGLKNAIAAVEVYRGSAPAPFAGPRATSFEVQGGQKEFITFGPDVDGDRRPDLILRAGAELLVFPGLAPDRAVSTPVATKPSRRVPLPADLAAATGRGLSMGTDGFQVARSAGGPGTPRLIDVDGDGRPEALFAGATAGGGGRVVVVWFRGAAPPAARGLVAPFSLTGPPGVAMLRRFRRGVWRRPHSGMGDGVGDHGQARSFQ